MKLRDVKRCLAVAPALVESQKEPKLLIREPL
jgi:hypothetical protein